MIWLLRASTVIVFEVPGYIDWHYGCQDRQQPFILLLLDIIRRPGDILRKALAASSNQLQLATKFLTPNFWRDILIADKGISTIRPGFSAWLFLVAIGTWNSYWRHLNNTYSTRARWIHLTLSVVVVVELGGEENILLASPPSWRRVHHATLEPGRACKKRLQVLLQNITGLSIIVLRQITSRKTERKKYLADRHPLFLLPWRRYFSAVTL